MGCESCLQERHYESNKHHWKVNDTWPGYDSEQVGKVRKRTSSPNDQLFTSSSPWKVNIRSTCTWSHLHTYSTRPSFFSKMEELCWLSTWIYIYIFIDTTGAAVGRVDDSYLSTLYTTLQHIYFLQLKILETPSMYDLRLAHAWYIRTPMYHYILSSCALPKALEYHNIQASTSSRHTEYIFASYV